MSRSSIITISILLAAFLIGWFWVWPQFSQVNVLRATTSELEERRSAEQQALQKIAELQDQLQQRSDQVAALEQAVPSSRDIASLVALLEEGANQNGLVMTSLAITDPEDQQRSRSSRQQAATSPSSLLESFTAQIELTGTYGAFQQFLDTVEASFPLLDISLISFRLPPASEGETVNESNPVFEYSVVMQTYYLK